MTAALQRFDADRLEPRRVLAALREHGALRVTAAALPPTLCRATLAATGAFFDLPPADKDAIHIRRSPHHRGYSVMHGERDFREQVHFGADEAHAAGAPHDRLRGPNLWPVGGLRAHVERHLAAAVAIATALSAALARACGWPHDPLVAAGAPYVLLKAICYHPQPADAPPRPGVAAHVDFSWLTLTLADDTAGLALRRPDGTWHEVAPDPESLLVHTGELLQFATGGELLATPHRVANPSRAQRRLSLPLFVLPHFATVLQSPPGAGAIDDPANDHVHRVLDGTPAATLAVGPAEWRRKGENRWCARCCAAT